MLTPALLDGLEASTIMTPRLRTHVITCGPADGEPVILLHGNVSAARFFEELMLAFPARYRVIAPDMRGYGRSEARPVDATRGMRDFSDDLHALVQTLDISRFHLLGWSLGGCVAMQYAIDHAAALASLTLLATGSPFGFGGSRDVAGNPSNAEFSGSGAGTANPEFVKLLKAGDRSTDSPTSPRNVMNSFYFKPPFRSPREDVFVEEMLLMAVGEDNYPGDFVTTAAWPGVGPGTRGVNNALSAKYCNLGALARIKPRPPILWVHGDADQIVSDTSLFDFGFLGQIGAVPGWPGAAICPPQPMVSQTRSVLTTYANQGGDYHEVVLEDCGHSPHIEKPDVFNDAFFSFLETADK
jgi:pimeloyl-ACP methyl ester carboxylesterase